MEALRLKLPPPVRPETEQDQLLLFWELPWIAHFVWLFQAPLCMRTLEPATLEAALASPQPQFDPVLGGFLSKLLVPDLPLRKQLGNEAFADDEINKLLARYLSAWLGEADSAASGSAGGQQPEDAEEPDSLESGEPTVRFNPLRVVYAGRSLHWLEDLRATLQPPNAGHKNFRFSWQALALETRVFLLHALCEYRMQASKEFADHLRELEPSSARVEPIGHDSLGNAYYNFGFGGYRIYRGLGEAKRPSPVRASKLLLSPAEYQKEYRRLYEEELSLGELEAEIAAHDQKEARAKLAVKRKRPSGEDGETESVTSKAPLANGGSAPRKRQKVSRANGAHRAAPQEGQEEDEEGEPDDDCPTVPGAAAGAALEIDEEIKDPELIGYLRMMGAPNEEFLRRICARVQTAAAAASDSKRGSRDSNPAEDEEEDSDPDDISVGRFLRDSGARRRTCREPPAPQWQLVCRTHQQMEALIKSLRKSHAPADKQLMEALAVVLEASVAEEEQEAQRRERLLQKAQADALRKLAPQRASTRIEKQRQERELRKVQEEEDLVARVEHLRDQRQAECRRLASQLLSVALETLVC